MGLLSQRPFRLHFDSKRVAPCVSPRLGFGATILHQRVKCAEQGTRLAPFVSILRKVGAKISENAVILHN